MSDVRRLVFAALFVVPVSVGVAGLAAQAIKNEAARRIEGSFSAPDVEARTSGKALSGAHGTSEMSIWGRVFEAIASDSGVAKLRVNNLVAYIKSIQVP